jgi:glutamyl-tRNA synthetase
MADRGKVVRIAPSPTGNLHVGTARTALFNYLFAKHTGGKFLIRIEDTDVERSKEEYEKNILESLEWLGIIASEPPVRQSERNEIYKKYAKKLMEQGRAVENDGAVILKNSQEEIVFQDLIRGEIKFEDVAPEIVLMKSDGTPTYNFAVVVDDAEMKITHVIRGEDHISNTPRQLIILEALGFKRPVYAHIPMILAPDRSKLSKRHGAVSVLEYRDKGYLPEAVVNYLALLGWNPGTDQEIFTTEELIEQFDLKKIQKGGAIFDEKKLEWVNKEHIKRLPAEEQKKLLVKSLQGESYMVGEPELDPEQIPWKKSTKEEALKHLEEIKGIIKKWSKPSFDQGEIMAYAEREGKGNVLWPLRYALSGAKASPDPITLLEILGIEKSLKRVERAIMVLNEI